MFCTSFNKRTERWSLGKSSNFKVIADGVAAVILEVVVISRNQFAFQNYGVVRRRRQGKVLPRPE